MNTERFYEDLKAFNEASQHFEAGEMTQPEYKGVSGGFGTYPQRGGEKQMLRLRLTGGRMRKDQLAKVLTCCHTYGAEHLKITSCQSLQVHDLTPEAVRGTLPQLLEVGIITRGGGGDNPRNVMASPLSGVEPGECFDVLPWAEAAGAYLLTFAGTVKFPRKLKVGFSNSPKNLTHVTFRDLGFAANPDGSFDLYAAGGLGNNPRLGIPITQGVAPEDILFYIRAMVEIFLTYGNYKSRAKARVRYLQETLGPEKLRELLLEYAEKYKAEQPELRLTDVAVPEVTKAGEGALPENPRVFAQRQPGLYSVLYHPPGGFFTVDQLEKIYETMKEWEACELRMSPDGALYVLHCTAAEAREMLAVTADSARTEFENSVCCVGKSRCAIGLCDSQDLLRNCLAAVRTAEIPDGALPAIRVSGCVSSCSAHQAAVLGFRGASKKVDGEKRVAYYLFRDGCELQGSEVLAEAGALMLAEDIPTFLVELGQLVAASGLSYAAWLPGHAAEMDELVAKYS